MAGLNQLISAVGAELGMQPHHLAKIFWGAKLVGFEQIWLDLGKNWEN